MPLDIFDYWAECPKGARIHPRDANVLASAKHGFDLRCLPASFDGPLRTAPVVLLYLSPGFGAYDLEDATSPEGQARYALRWTGTAPLTGPDEHPAGFDWWSTRTARFGPWETLRDKVAVLNIGPYKSATFRDWPMLSALPTCRAVLEWAQGVLFP